jgi:PTS system fructose-specific IIA component/PTS system nitrogen regulatory IIA component
MDAAKVTHRIRAAHCLPSIESGAKDDAIRELCDRLATTGAIPKGKADALAAEVMKREGQGTTGIGGGVAVPHAKTSLVKELTVAVGLAKDGLDFSSVDGERVQVVFLIASPPEAAQEHLAFMRWVVTFTRSKYWTKLLKGCTTAEAMAEVLEESTTTVP